MADFFIKVRDGQGEQPATFQRIIMEHDIRNLAIEVGVTMIKNEGAVDVIGRSSFEELSLDVREGLFSLESLKTAMEELGGEHGPCSLRQLRKRSIELQQGKQVKPEILTGKELS